MITRPGLVTCVNRVFAHEVHRRSNLAHIVVNKIKKNQKKSGREFH